MPKIKNMIVRLILSIGLIFLSHSTFGQIQRCPDEFTYEIKENEGTYSIDVIGQKFDSYSFSLYNLSDNNQLIIRKTSNDLEEGVLRFSDIVSGYIYIIQVKGEDNCLYTIGGMEGIKP